MRFNAKTEIITTDTLAATVRDLVVAEQVNRVGVVVDAQVADQDSVGELLAALGETLTVSLWKVASQEPTTALVNTTSQAVRDARPELLVGIGGGSVLDLTKAVSVLAVHEGKIEDFHGTGKAIPTALKKILIPTTAGTGSEVTPGAVLVNEETKFKRAIGSKAVSADYAVLDAGLTVTMPAAVTAATGLDALGHAIEAYTTRCANDVTRMYARQAFAMVFNQLPEVFRRPKDRAARERILLGSTLAGYAIYNSNTGAAHSISYAMGLWHQVPHGLAVGLLLPEVVRINVEKGCHLYADLFDLIETEAEQRTLLGPKEKAERFARLLGDYPVTRKLDRRLDDFGVTSENVGHLAERGLDLAPALENNPVEFTLADSQQVLTALLAAG